MTALDTPMRELEDLSIASREVLDAHGLRTVADVLRWAPPRDLHPLVFDNLQAILEDLDLDWPPS